MSRYTGWRRLSGDASARPDLADLGKKMLGHLAEQRRLSGVKTMSAMATAPDGSVVRARFIGDLPQIDVKAATPAGRGQAPDPFTPQGFVVTARNTTLPTGIDAAHPEQILQFADDEWTTYFYDTTSDTFTLLTGNKSTYGRRFRDGIGNAGNIDWIGSLPEGGTDADRIRLNWYGPMRRYWYDGWRKPDAQYGPYVFLNGRVLLDIEAVNTEREAAELAPFAETYVLGAAYRDGWLYVMQAAINDFGAEATTIPDQPNFVAGTASWITPPYPDGDTSLRLVRYRLSLNANPVARSFSYSVGAGESLWLRTGRGYVNPWVFNPACTVCETFAAPDEIRAMSWAYTAGIFKSTLPSSSSEHIELEIGTDGEISEAVSELSVEIFSDSGTNYPGDPPVGLVRTETAVIAADYAPSGERVVLEYINRIYKNASSGSEEHDQYRSTVRVGSTEEIDLRDVSFDDDTNIYSGKLFDIVTADLRHGLLVVDGGEGNLWATSGERPRDIPCSLRLYEQGVLVNSIESDRVVSASWIYAHVFEWVTTAATAFWVAEQGQLFNVSPLFLLDGIAQWGQYIPSPSLLLQSQLRLRSGGQYPVRTPAPERAGKVRWHPITTSGAAGTFDMAAGDSDLSFMAADYKGYRTPASLSSDGVRTLLSMNRLELLYNAPGSGFSSGAGWIALWGAPSSVRSIFGAGDPVRFFSSSYVTDTTLGALTSIGGDDSARFSPIWQLGAFPLL